MSCPINGIGKSPINLDLLLHMVLAPSQLSTLLVHTLKTKTLLLDALKTNIICNFQYKVWLAQREKGFEEREYTQKFLQYIVIVSVDVNVSAVSVVNFFVDIDVNLIVVLVGVIDVVADVDVDWGCRGSTDQKKEATQQFLHSISWRRSDGQPTAYSTGSNTEVGWSETQRTQNEWKQTYRIIEPSNPNWNPRNHKLLQPSNQVAMK